MNWARGYLGTWECAAACTVGTRHEWNFICLFLMLSSGTQWEFPLCALHPVIILNMLTLMVMENRFMQNKWKWSSTVIKVHLKMAPAFQVTPDFFCMFYPSTFCALDKIRVIQLLFRLVLDIHLLWWYLFSNSNYEENKKYMPLVARVIMNNGIMN